MYWQNTDGGWPCRHVDLRGSLTSNQGRGNGTTVEPMFKLKLLVTMCVLPAQPSLPSLPPSLPHSARRRGGRPRLLPPFRSDGTQHTVLTSKPGKVWEAGASPTTFNNIYLGEKYDAAVELKQGGPTAWSTAAGCGGSAMPLQPPLMPLVGEGGGGS